MSAARDYPALDSFPPTGTPVHQKPSGYDLYRKLGSPKRIVAPMVEHSELPWRILSRRHGAELIYSPMINAKIYAQNNRGAHRVREGFFNREFGEEGAHELKVGDKNDTDRPLIVQFCANDPDQLLYAAKTVEDRCDAVDLNLGCPQQIARRGNFGAFLQEDWGLIFQLINRLHLELAVPVTAKFRVLETTEKTIAYARMIERAGAQMVTVHGRTREMKGHKTGMADWEQIRAVKEALSVPVFANGNIMYPQDWRDALEYTGADGVMSAEGNLYIPSIFSDALHTDLSQLARTDADRDAFGALEITRIAHEYLDIVAGLATPTSSASIKGHMFKITRPALAVHTDLRPVLGQARSRDDVPGEERIAAYREFVHELERRLEDDRKKPEYYEALPDNARYYVPLKNVPNPDDRTARPTFIPHWYLQPYFRPPLNPPNEGKKEKSKAEAPQPTAPPDSADAAHAPKRTAADDEQEQDAKRPRTDDST